MSDLTPEPTLVRGTVEPGFEQLPDVFGRLVAAQRRGGASLSVYVRGREVAALTAGDYRRDDLQLVFSVAKLVVALAVHRAAAQRLVDLDLPLSRYWAELGEGADEVTLRDVLAHRSGYSRLLDEIAVDRLLAGEDRAQLERQPAESREGHAYHAVTFGSLVEGVLSRAIGVTTAELVRSQIAEPLHLDLYLGVSDALLPRVRPVLFEPPAVLELSGFATFRPPVDQALNALLQDPELFNSRSFLVAGLPSMGLVATAGSLARMMAATLADIDGVALLSPAEREAICQPRSTGIDGSLGVETNFGSGVQLPFPRLPWTGPTAFGHEGAGGSAAFADPSLQLAVGFTTDLFPRSAGASPVLLALLPTLRLLTEDR